MARAISDSEKVKIASSFIHNAPPGEFNEVFSDVRALISNDQLLKDGASQAFAEYNMEQFIPAIIGDGKDQVIVSRHGLVDGGRFLDPRTKRTFKYDHLKKEASDVRPTSIDERAEAYRAALEASLTSYAKDHYPNGVVTVYGSAVGGGVKLIACIEDHKYNPNNFWNGRWRSEWSATISGSSTEVKGSIKVQVCMRVCMYVYVRMYVCMCVYVQGPVDAWAWPVHQLLCCWFCSTMCKPVWSAVARTS